MARPRPDPRIQLEPVSAQARIWWFGLAVLLPTVIVGVSMVIVIASGEEVSLSDILSTAPIVPLMLAIWWLIDRFMTRHHLTLDAGGLEVVTTFYRRRIGYGDLLLDRARIVNPAERPEFKPVWKINGVGLPGFSSGWFRLREHGKALVAVSGGRRALWIPTTQDFGLLLQSRQPQVLLQQLQEHAHRRVPS